MLNDLLVPFSNQFVQAHSIDTGHVPRSDNELPNVARPAAVRTPPSACGRSVSHRGALTEAIQKHQAPDDISPLGSCPSSSPTSQGRDDERQTSIAADDTASQLDEPCEETESDQLVVVVPEKRTTFALSRQKGNSPQNKRTAGLTKSLCCVSPRSVIHGNQNIFKKSLAAIAFPGLAGGNETEAVISPAARILAKRDPNGPIYVTKDDLDNFERRRVITVLPKQAIKVAGRIRYIIAVLSALQIQQMREAYFAEVSRLRAQGLPTEHLSHRNALNARRQKSREGVTGATRLALYLDNNVEVFVDKLVAHLLRQDDDKTLETTDNTKCLLCFDVFKNISSLTRHVKRRHTFDTEFHCPECRQQGRVNIVPAGGPSWSSHVESFHGKEYTPRLFPQMVRPAYCPLCQKYFTKLGFRSHFNKAPAGKLKFSFNCPECLRNGLKDDSSVIKSHSNWSLHVENIHEGGVEIRGAVVRAGKKRKRSIYDRSAYEVEMQKPPDRHQDEEFWNSGRE
ncbi:zinc finger domain-containing protein [Metarhizium robertsii ARSEF 23]|uniref:Zinc finger domain-containing protein n=1 Tax=Metarhizium robertsii (strain ARSEF 23 / ATCC MYA-3075) TaxID=655844 RepID=E9F1R5_METRA|nr:zinc finger domain-containing protein [Metarhizium robertsii ARSEF 23]EFY98004.2 zinc finger domain-containing protein [Metarhizium robertsii ARSEF 23]